MSDTDVYTESDTHIPEPTDQSGTLDTSGTSGAAHGKLEEITPIFAIAKAQNDVQAARALDPDDDGVDASMVVMPQAAPTYVVDEAAIRERIVAKAEKAQELVDAPVGVTPGPAQRAAAEEGPTAAQKAENQRADQGVGGKAEQVTPTTQPQSPQRPAVTS